MAAKLPHSQPQQQKAQALAGQDAGQAGGGPRFALRIVRYATQLLDPDNYAGGCKGLIDIIRQSRLIPDDDLKSVTITFDQVKVSKRADQGTRLFITEHPE